MLRLFVLYNRRQEGYRKELFWLLLYIYSHWMTNLDILCRNESDIVNKNIIDKI